MNIIRGIPALDDTDALALVGQYSRDLRDRLLDGIPFRLYAGRTNVTTIVGGTASLAVAIPVGRFTVTPLMWAAANTSSPANYIADITPMSTTAATLRVADTRSTGTPVTIAVSWWGIQMLPTAAAG